MPISRRKRSRPRKDTLKFLNKNKPQKKKQKRKNDNLEGDENAIDSDYEFDKNLLIKENIDLGYFSDESDILMGDNFLQHKIEHLENTEKGNHGDVNDDFYAQTQNIVSEDLKSRPPPEPPPDEKDLPAVNPTTNRNIIECQDQLTMHKDDYAHFISTKTNHEIMVLKFY